MLGVNFYRNRSFERRCLSMIILIVNCIISEYRCFTEKKRKSTFYQRLVSDVYFVGYVLYLTLNKPFQAERVAVSISRGTWVVQATLSTVRSMNSFRVNERLDERRLVNERRLHQVCILISALSCMVAVHESAMSSSQIALRS